MVAFMPAPSCQTLRYPMDYSPPGCSTMGFPRQEYWSGLPFSLPGDLPDSGTELESPALAAGYFTTKPAGKPVRNGWASENFGNVNEL